MSDADIKKTIIKGTVNGGSVISILDTEGVTIRGLAIQGSGDINTDEAGSSRGWVYEDGTVVPDDILDIIGWDSNEKMLSDDNINGNVNPVAVSIFQGSQREAHIWFDLDCCDAGIWIEASTVTAAVNGSISGATALVLDGNVGTIEVGDIVTGDGIYGTVTVSVITNQNNITLSNNQSIADNVALTFTFPYSEKTLRFTDGSRSFYTVNKGF